MKRIEINNAEELNCGRREAMNSLKTNVQFAGVDIKTVAITSCNQGEGKSTIAFDLARSMAESGKMALLIDADMRKSQLVTRHKIDNNGNQIKGLTHYLSGQSTPDEILCSTNIPGMHMILLGPFSTNPTELLAGDKFSKLIKLMEKAFDCIIIDTPPLGAVIDTAIMAPSTDGVIIVLEANSTSIKAAQNASKQVEVTGARILGYVLNKVSDKNGYYYSKYKYYGK